MVDIRVKSFDCPVCRTLFTAPLAINKIQAEFKIHERFRLDVPKTERNERDEIQNLSSQQREQIKDGHKSKRQTELTRVISERPNNTFRRVTNIDTADILDEDIQVDIIEAKVRSSDDRDLTKSKDITLECPICLTVAYEVKGGQTVRNISSPG